MKQQLSTIKYLPNKKTLTFEPLLSEFYDPTVGQKNGELLFAAKGTDLATCALYKYLRQVADEKLNEVYYQSNYLLMGGKTIRQLHKMTSLPKQHVKLWLEKQVFSQVHITAPKEIKHSYYEVTKPHEHNQFDLLYIP